MSAIRMLALAGLFSLSFAACSAARDNVVAEPVTEAVEVPLGEGVALAGTLHLPAPSDTPAPAVILYPGSQASTNLPGLAAHLAAQGIVALDLNKRGVAGSGGHWSDETIERQADDALAAYAFLQTRPEVDAARIGIAGHSQGGWVAQLAAAREPELGFIILLAGPTQTVREQILTDERYHLTGWGVPPAEVDARIDMFGDFMEAALTNPAVCSPQGGHYLCGLFRYDPEDALSAIQVPVLALYGENDPMTPPELNEADLRAALAHLPEGALTTRVFESANHVFWASQTGLRDEYPQLTREYVPGFLDTISDWVLER
ncbi:MAG: alpha/beta hydrolase family protein [Glycocaulis sp.]